MSLFPRAFFHQDQSSSPTIFRLLDEIDQFSRGVDRNSHQITKSFTPKFDVKELGDSFELHGELPGIDQKDVDIEFTDASTLTIKGRVERSYSKGSPPAGFVEGEADKAAICGDGKCGTTSQDNNVSVKKSEDSKTSLESSGASKSGECKGFDEGWNPERHDTKIEEAGKPENKHSVNSR
ncbi:heat shock protein 30 [Blumeria hordei DH14]|uniref:Heat shock protein 30 n=1 Tax=Blumeria graminis f. sp. hordei (strain DH14) TaxID=546991 RepID=N1J991_BLUG1|nr:heat shock protein 30 [Blumeria hordei DH14]